MMLFANKMNFISGRITSLIMDLLTQYRLVLPDHFVKVPIKTVLDQHIIKPF